MFLRFLLFLTLIAFSQASFAQSFSKSIKKHRKAYVNKFKTNEHAPLKGKELKKMRFFAADEAYAVKATFSRTTDASPFDMTTYSGVSKPYIQYGTAEFKLRDTVFQLTIYQSLNLRKMPQYKDYLFVPFKDYTNDETSYGGGRYLDLKIGDIKNGTVLLDFNKAYNPYCAYSDGYSCPVPPIENHLKTEIQAGEKKYAGAYKKN